MSRVVRSSKYRHVFGEAAKLEDCYQNLLVTRNAWDTNIIKANSKYYGIIWESGGGGSFAVAPHEKKGKWTPNDALYSSHKGPVLDIDFNPFNDNLIASVSEDGNCMIWNIPNHSAPVQTLQGHKRKVGTANFNPVANNVLATSSGDFFVKLWDIEQGKCMTTVEGHADIIQSLDWNYTGNLVATASKDKKTRVFDPRTNEIAHKIDAHEGVKGSRVCWLKDKLLTIGFTKTSEREFKIWDIQALEKPLATLSIDTAAGIIMPFFDIDNNVLYLAGKGDGNIRYYEITDEAPYYHFLSEYKSSEPQRGLAFVPKRALDFASCEIARGLKVTPNKMQPISFKVPRKSDIFQDDLYPDSYAGIPVYTAEEWTASVGQTPKPPVLTSLAPGFVAKEKPTTEFKPVAQAETGPKNEKELRDEYEKLKSRVSYLESELIKRDSRIKELESK